MKVTAADIEAAELDAIVQECPASANPLMVDHPFLAYKLGCQVCSRAWSRWYADHDANPIQQTQVRAAQLWQDWHPDRVHFLDRVWPDLPVSTYRP